MELKYDEYPESCPPLNSEEVEGTFYRLCKSSPPTDEDFKTHIDRGVLIKGKECASMALSFYDSRGSTEEMKKKFSKKFGNYYISEFYLTKDLGKALLEGNHLNLWEYKNIGWLTRDNLLAEEVSNESDRH
ncbi:hypothetical protein ACFP65_07960 [Marinilactibacillus sp. GCM10026970]|uniref:hypothetical protein n=1 Tax=Marinilactibacillus sp. GCM10026970 TaxID=3252642 RepID=UPI0036151BAB